jgi:hypothetical protein
MVYRSQKYFSPVGEQFRDFAKSFGAQHLEPESGAEAFGDISVALGGPGRPSVVRVAREPRRSPHTPARGTRRAHSR